MIHSVVVTNYVGETVTIELSDPEPDHGFLITSIDGLGPTKANINTTELANADGSIFNSARRTQRNIVIDLLFIERPDIETTRQRTYKYFPEKKRLHLRFYLDNRIVDTYGYVESNTPDIFSKKEGCQISIICDDPFLYSINETTTVLAGRENAFEFPFSNELLNIIDPIKDQNEENIVDHIEDPILGNWWEHDTKAIEFSYINEATQKSIYYDGDAEVGLTFKIHVLGPVKNIFIYNTGTREKIKIDTDKIEELTGKGLDDGDELIITTMRKNRRIILKRGGIDYNVLSSRGEGSTWLELQKGYNTFGYMAEVGPGNMEFQIINQVLYDGV